MVRTLVWIIGSSKTGNSLTCHYCIALFLIILAGVQAGVWEVTLGCHVTKAINAVLLQLPVIRRFKYTFLLFFLLQLFNLFKFSRQFSNNRQILILSDHEDEIYYLL
jgi:hypothetical protein